MPALSFADYFRHGILCRRGQILLPLRHSIAEARKHITYKNIIIQKSVFLQPDNSVSNHAHIKLKCLTANVIIRRRKS